MGKLLDAFSQFVASGEALADTLTTAGRASALLAAVQDMVGVMEQTKRSFSTRALGNLHERLEAVLGRRAARLIPNTEGVFLSVSRPGGC